MFTQFLEISSRFIHADKAKGVKRLLYSTQQIEHKISIFYETINQMKEQKYILYGLRNVENLFRTGLITMFCPFLAFLKNIAI